MKDNYNKTTEQLPVLSNWLLCHWRALLRGIGELLRTPFASLMTLIVIGIAMTLPLSLYVVLQNVQYLNKHWGGVPTLSLYLQQNIQQNQINAMIITLQQDPKIAKVEYISPQQGLQEFEKNSLFSNVIQTLKTNPLPGVVVITPRADFQTPHDLQNFLNSFKALPQVEFAQLDTAWIKRLYYIVMLGKRIAYALALFISLGVILIIANTIRLTMQSHRQEIAVLKLIGANNAFIRRPLLYRGLLYGLLGGAFACALIGMMLLWLRAPARALEQSYGNSFFIHGLNSTSGMAVVLLCGLLGFIGSWVAMRKHLSSRNSR